MNRLITDSKDNWQRLENLLDMMGSSIKNLSRTEVREFGELYRRAAADLAIARAETRDPKLVNYLNSLVIRAHGKIYRAEGKGASIIWNFFAKEFPRAFRRTWAYTFVSFLLFTIPFVGAIVLAINSRDFVTSLGVAEAGYQAQSNMQWWKSLNDANQIGATAILANNILVAFKALTYGAFLGVGSVYVLVHNGLYIGGVVGACFASNPSFGVELVNFMIGHGVIELSCIFIAGGAGMRLGYSVINPGDLSRIDSLKRAGLEAVRLAFGCAVLLVIAGLIEGFLSPSDLPPYIKWGIGILTGLLMYSYLLFAGHEEEVPA
jgi:uncharacterized membrane protein SpoIIM required for sporulation